jgi:signal transduction histidine kinase
MGFVLVHLPFVGVVVLINTGMPARDWIILALVGLPAFATVVLRRHYPTWFLTGASLALCLQIAVVPYPTISWILLPLAVYDVSRWMPAVVVRVSLGVALVITVVGGVRWLPANSGASDVVRTAMIFVAVSVAGAVTTAYSLGRRRYEVEAALERQRQLEADAAELHQAEQAARQRSLETEIRTNIARELHDIVAHSISVMVVQAEGGLVQVQRRPERAQQALSQISDTGREALHEMRRIVRTLRSSTERGLNMSSAPNLADLSALVDKAQATLTISGTPHGSTPSIEMTIYRVIQEALTNSLKHGGPDADPHVLLAWHPLHVSVTVTNHVGSTPEMNDQRGTGLIGMAERVQALEGTLTVGPTDTGGFRVCAQIPLNTNQRGQ